MEVTGTHAVLVLCSQDAVLSIHVSSSFDMSHRALQIPMLLTMACTNVPCSCSKFYHLDSSVIIELAT